MVANDVFRGRYRTSFEHPEPIVPNAVLEYVVDLHTQDYRFLRGHRIMVQVQSTWFPHHRSEPAALRPEHLPRQGFGLSEGDTPHLPVRPLPVARHVGRGGPVIKTLLGGRRRPLMLAYHDEEWGVPMRGTATCSGSSCSMASRPGSPGASSCTSAPGSTRRSTGFDPERMARYDRKKIAQLLKDPGIVRNRQKVHAAISNARAFLEFPAADGAFGAFLWSFVGGGSQTESPPLAPRPPGAHP